MDDGLILDVHNLKQHFTIKGGLFQRVQQTIKAVDGVSFSVKEGEVLGLVGESGCGKTTVGRSILRLYEPSDGHVYFRTAAQDVVDITSLGRTDMKALRREMRMIFQDPFSSLNPRWTVKDIIAEPLEIHNNTKGRVLDEHVALLMEEVGLEPSYMRRYPHEFSGGQRQRIGIARTLALRPRLIIADEPVSALDVSVQAQVINLLQELKETYGLTIIFIAHDLSIVEHFCDRIAVMYVGKIVELAETETLIRQPKHPYTEALISAVPPADPDTKPARIILEGDVPSPANPPTGCIFHPRCRYAQPPCKTDIPVLTEQNKRLVACHYSDTLTLGGADG